MNSNKLKSNKNDQTNFENLKCKTIQELFLP